MTERELTPDQRRMREMIERRLAREGWSAESWRLDDDYSEPRPVAVVGRFRVLEDDDERGLYSGDEGELSAEIVGSAKYRNEQVSFSFMADGYDSGNEVRDLSILDPVA